MSPPRRRLGIDRIVKRRRQEAVRRAGQDLLRIRTDAGATQRQVSDVAGIDRSHYSRIEAGNAEASLATLVAIATALGADVSVRFYPGTGPRLTDRHQARMIETLLRSLDPGWISHLEVPVVRPVRGVVDLVLVRRSAGLVVVAEAQSELRRLEQQIRWSMDKAGSIESARIPLPPSPASVSRLLLLRSTAATRELARQFETTLRTAYPAATQDVVGALTAGGAWPGAGIVWVRIEGDRVELLDSPPRGVALGR